MLYLYDFVGSKLSPTLNFMKKIIVFLLAASLSVTAQETQEKKKEEDPLKKAEAAFDKAFDGLFKTKKKEETTTKTDSPKEKPSTKETKDEKPGGGFGGFSFGGKPKANYNFESSMTMKMTMKGTKEKENTTMRNKYMFTKDGKAMGVKFLGSDNPDMQKASGSMDALVMDFEQNKMFTFMTNDGKKTLMAMGFKNDPTQQAIEKEPAKVKITKSNEAKTIVGYKCDGYWIENDEKKDKIMMWVSQNRVGEMAKMTQKMAMGSSPNGSKGATKNYMAYYSHPEFAKLFEQGKVVLGYTSKTEKGEQVDMEVEEIKPNDKIVFDTAGYKTMF